MKKNSLYKALAIALPLLGGLGATSSCSDMLDTDSDIVMFQEDNTLNHETDSVYSVMGIIHKIQVIADRTVLLGDIRSDLTATTEYANEDLKALANFEVNETNRYNRISDYYAVINNCNYFLANVNLALEKRGYKVFEKEYAAVKAFRAWTYMQAVLAYGKIPLVTTPVLTENEAQAALNQTPVDIAAICDYFIEDLKPYIDTKKPSYGSVGDFSSSYFFFPVRVLLGDFCLWAGRYLEAATYYHEYLTKVETYMPIGTNAPQWRDIKWSSTAPVLSGTLSYISYIPMESSEYYGIMTDLPNIYSSTKYNNQYAQAGPSAALFKLSRDQFYCMEYAAVPNAKPDTLYADKEGLYDELYAGDLRLALWYSTSYVNQDKNSTFSAERQRISKHSDSRVYVDNTVMVYLRFAEALNRLGLTQSAFAILKYGLQNSATSSTIAKYIDEVEREQAGVLLDFDPLRFDETNTIGIHARGCGDAHADKEHYSIPMPPTALATRADTVAYQQPLIEDLIMTESALEGSFMGNRYYDLMRVAMRRGAPSYLADAVARRNGTLNAALREKLMNPDNWYLPKP